MSQRVKVLFVPMVRAEGITSERTPKMLEMLSSMFEVTGVPMGRMDAFVFDQSRSKPARYLLFLPDVLNNSRRVLRHLREGGHQVIFAEGSYYSLAASLAAWLRRIPLIWDNHGNIVTFSQVQGKSSFFSQGNLLFERQLQALSAKVLVVNERDRRDYAAAGFRASKLEVVPTCADMDLVARSMRPRREAKQALGIPADEKVVLFMGTMRYGPNAEAASYLASILPGLRRAHPTVKVYVAGSGEPPVAAPEGMRFLGFVPDIYIWLSAADVCAAPMWRGLGILTKVIDSMSAGRATVVSPLALDGIPELEDGRNCLIGRDREGFALKLEELLADEGLRERLASAGRRLMEERYSCAVVSSHLRQMVESVAGTKESLS